MHRASEVLDLRNTVIVQKQLPLPQGNAKGGLYFRPGAFLVCRNRIRL
jgi:hypothetical protein